ncbi:MAG TPA: sigma 54-interacting transcriptional regulator [Pyrinomonadaceae bacterium]|jgi:formate hydrogenlyase transcriptional activator
MLTDVGRYEYGDSFTTGGGDTYQAAKIASEFKRDGQDFAGIIGSSAILKQVLHQARVVASTDSTVLILGETGTGKELIAKAIHDLSSRRNQKFVKLNCAALPATLVEAELFGHERGAFTGATNQRAGRFELAHRGTFLLDEVGDLPLELQPKILRILQEQEFERLGSSRTQKVDVRLIAATHQNLIEKIEENEFRRDLYYRLNVFPIKLPALRERREDIMALACHFAQKYAAKMRRRIEEIPLSTLKLLRDYDYPGNVRELENIIERAVILAADDGVLRSEYLHLDETAPRQASSTNEGTLAVFERKFILQTLEKTDWKVGGERGAAASLGLKRTTLISKMEKLGIARQSEYRAVG